MKNTLLAITFLAVTAFAAGCKPAEDNSTAQQLDKVKTETKADAQAMKDYAFAQKAEFVADMQGQLDALNKDLDQLSAKIDKSSDAVKADAKPKLQALRDEAAKMNKQLDEARNATESTWDSVKAGSRKTWDALEERFPAGPPVGERQNRALRRTKERPRIMRDHHKQTEFLKHCLGYDESARCRELKQEITRIQRDERCVRRAVWLMAILTALAVAGLGYPAILLANFPYSAPQTIVNLVCALGVASLVSLVAFVILGMVYRKMLDRRREECRLLVARLLESRLGNPPATPWREGPARDESRGTVQAACRRQWFSSRDGIRPAGLKLRLALAPPRSGRHSARDHGMTDRRTEYARRHNNPAHCGHG